MTRNQTKIYNWLLNKPGFLKKGKISFYNYYKNKIDNNVSNNDIDIALKQARIDFKQPKVKIDTTTPRPAMRPLKQVSTIKYNPNNVLAIADMHEPFCKKGYLEHCVSIRDKYKCGTIVLIGDEVDLCGVSQWEKDPDGFSAGTEASLAQEKMKKWYKAFPTAYVCIGNHTARPFRMAKQNGIPKKFIKSYEEAWEAPKTWKWAESWVFNNVFYTHGTGFSGANAAIRIASMHRQNTVIGHVHSEAGIQYQASKIDLVWGMQLGGALDDKSYAAQYAKEQIKKSIIGCGIILDGTLPIYEPMKL